MKSFWASGTLSGDPRPSPVLLALGLPDARVRGSVRVGIGRFITEAEFDRAAARLVEEVPRVRTERPAADLGRRD